MIKSIKEWKKNFTNYNDGNLTRDSVSAYSFFKGLNPKFGSLYIAKSSQAASNILEAVEAATELVNIYEAHPELRPQADQPAPTKTE